MRRIAVINQKGGVGKTTTTVNLGAGLASVGQRVLLVDLDPQAHLTMHVGHEVGDGDPTIYEVLTDRTPIVDCVRDARDRIALVPAHTDLAGAETELVNTVGREVILREALDAVDAQYDVMMIDCPPSLSVLTVNALAAVDEVVIPLQTHFLGLQGLGKLLETMTLVRRRINPKLSVSGIVLCMFDTGTRLAGEVLDDLSGFLEGCRGQAHVCADARLFRTKVRRNIKLAEAPSFGQTIFDYAPQSNGAIDYLSLAAEVMLDDPEARAALARVKRAEPDQTSAASEGGISAPTERAHGPITTPSVREGEGFSTPTVREGPGGVQTGQSRAANGEPPPDNGRRPIRAATAEEGFAPSRPQHPAADAQSSDNQSTDGAPAHAAAHRNGKPDRVAPAAGTEARPTAAPAAGTEARPTADVARAS